MSESPPPPESIAADVPPAAASADSASVAQAPSRLAEGAKHLAFVAAVGLAVCLLTLYFFCPRFYLWRGATLGIPQLLGSPEANRAAEVLKQVEDPRIVITHPSNFVVSWRLFFPWLGHLLKLSPVEFLALPFVGCWAAAALAVHVLLRETGSRLLAFVGAFSFCCTAWFFVSTAWLSYNDSWIVFGLTAAAAVRSRWVLLISCLLMPWIEERFLLVLPTALALRPFIFTDRTRPIRDLTLDVLTALAGISWYCGTRAYSYWAGTDPVTDLFVAHTGAANATPLFRYFEATWAAFRSNWFFVVLWVWLAWRAPPRWLSVTAVIGMLISIPLVHRINPGDLHRNVGTFAPVILAGIVLAYRRWPQFTLKSAIVVLVLNLVLPANQVITVFKYPIFNVFVEWDKYENNTNPLLNAKLYHDQAVQLAQAQQFEQSMLFFDYSLRLDPKFHQSRTNKAMVLLTQGRVDQALIELNLALEIKPDAPEPYYVRGLCREKKGDYRGAVADFDRAIKTAPADWQFMPQAKQQYKRLRDVGISPN